MRSIAVFLASLLVANSGIAQGSRDLRDPETGEPIPAGFSAPPADYDGSANRGGYELTPLQHVAEGSTKLVRTHPNGMLFQNGAYLISGEILHPSPDTAFVEEFDRVTLSAQSADMVIRENLAYVALRKNRGLLILDITNPLDVEEVGALEGEDLLAIDVLGDYAYVGRGIDGIGVYDISDPAAPELIHTLDTPGSANGVAVEGTTMYVADGNNPDGPELWAYDISDPEQAPFLLSGFETGGFVTDVAISPTATPIILVAGDFGLKVVYYFDPLNPVELGSHPLNGGVAFEIATVNSSLPIYIAAEGGVYAVDMGDPANPEVIQSFEGINQGLSVAIHEFHNLALVADRYEGLRITDASLPGDLLPQIGFLENAGFSNKAFFHGDELYVTDLSGRLRILDVSNVFDGVDEIARIRVPPNTQEVHVENNRAYVTDSDFAGTGLTILDVSDATDPTIIGGWNSSNQAFGLDVLGDTLYLANGLSGLVALDVSDPANVQQLGSFPMGSNTVDVVVDSARAVAFAVNYGAGMFSIDVSDPANMLQLDAETGWGFLNAISFDYEPFDGTDYDFVSLAGGEAGVRHVNVQNPSALSTDYVTSVPSLAKDVSSGTVHGGDVIGQSNSVADDVVGLLFIGFSSIISSFTSADRGVGVAQLPETLNGGAIDLIALTSGETGVYLLSAPVPQSNESELPNIALQVNAPHPNPLGDQTILSYTLAVADVVSLAVYDLLGRRVATLVDGVQAAGSHEVTFDASRLPSGVYILRLTAGDQVATTKVSVVH